MRNPTLLVTAAVFLLATPALAAPDVTCKPSETQAECHDRLKCKPDEELEDCQKRLAKQGGQGQGQQGQGQQGQGQGDNGSRGNDRGRDEGRRDNGERDNRGGERGRNEGREDRGGGGGGGERGRRRSSSGSGGGGGFVANKVFGLGLELGEPTGLNGKVFVSPRSAVDFGLGYIYDHYYYGDGFHAYVDYLFHFLLTSNESFYLPIYIGPGLRFWDFHYCYAGVCGYGGDAIGIRLPIGISFDFNNAPLDIFLEAVPTLDLLGGAYATRYNEHVHFGIDGSLGFRYWFK